MVDATKPAETPVASVPAHQVQRNWGEVCDRALRGPVVITTKGRPRYVLMAFEEYERLKARDRRAYLIEGLPDDLAAMLEAGLDDLRNPNTSSEDRETLIGDWRPTLP